MSVHSLSGMSGPFALALANHLWQSTIVAAVAGLLTLALRRNYARARYALWLAASIKFLVPFSLLMVLGGHLASLRHATPQRSATVESFAAIDEFSQPFTIDAPNLDERPTVHVAAVSVTDRLIALCNREPLLPAALAAAWLIGFLAITARWAVRWVRISAAIQRTAPLQEGREFEALQRVQRLAGLRRTIELRSLPAAMEPGIFGLFRPVLLWPQDITGRLEDAHLEAVLAHEVFHVRRRDNLTAALHMVVEAIFWFYPLVWWLETRLVEEREHACDEEVLQLCGQRGIYAESILKVCEFCVESPMACVSGVTGADLKQRIVQILTERTVLKLTWGKKLLIGATALLVVAVPIVLGEASGVTTGTQDSGTRDATAQLPKFEVASIRPCKDPSQEPPIGHRPGANSSPGRLDTDCVELLNLIGNAYNAYANGHLNLNAEPTPLNGGPPWLHSAFYEIKAKAEGNPSVEMMFGPMMQALLEERFHLKIHRQTSEGPVYFLTVAHGGAKLHPFAEGSCTLHSTFPPPPLQPGKEYCETLISGISPSVVAQGATLDEFSKTLRVVLDRPVINRTGISGRFDLRVQFSREGTGLDAIHPNGASPASDPTGPPSIFTALQEQLGLKLESGKGPVDTIVIDSAEKPTVDGAEVQQPASVVPVAMMQEKASSAPASDSAQPSAYVPTMAFDVASVRESKQDPNQPHSVGGRFEPHSTNLRLQNVQMYYMVTMAYGISIHEIEGLPDWGWTSFNIEAKSDSAADDRLAKLDKDSVKLEQEHMMQALLAERFHLRVHWTSEEGPIYNLVLAKGGSKLLPAGSMAPPPEEQKWLHGEDVPPLHQQGDGRLGYEFYGHSCPIEDLVRILGAMMGRNVVDQTGLTGNFDFHLQYHHDRTDDDAERGGGMDDPTVWPPITVAVQDQLGLKLVPAKGQVRKLVVDNVEMPSPN